MRKLTVLLVVVASLWAGEALAGPQVWEPLNSCTTTNCSARPISGTYVFNSPGNSNPFILQVFAYANECLRLDVKSQNTDLEMILISPNGLVYRNDDRAGSADRRPLLQVTPTPVRGWYTLQLSRWDGMSPSADFSLMYGRYNAFNPNCSAVTLPMGAEMSAPDSKDFKSEETVPTFRTPRTGPND